MRARTLWLVGMMGAGKSSVGAALARRLGRRFVDADAEIERAAGRRVAEIFAREGEAGFRARERELIERLGGAEVVVALGGGAFAQPGAPERLLGSGEVVHLRARPETLLERLGEAAERPLLAGLGREERRARLAGLLAERTPAYARATLAVDTDGLSVDEVAAAIAGRLFGEARGGRAGSRRAVRPRAAPAPQPLRRLEVELGERGYPIAIGSETLAGVGEEVARRTGANLAVVVTVPSLARRYAPVVLRSLREAGLRAHRLVIPDGDASKSLARVRRLYDALLDLGVDRSGVLVALGGGMVGDLTGFTAATYLRGIPFVQIPTTLLAMVDASVGGKVGVNLPRGKNLVGAFHQPRLVWIDLATLHSLPARERAAGLAEVVKKAAVFDARLFEALEAQAGALLALEPAPLLAAVERACAIKADVVRRDEREGEAGVRKLLNFGHTLGHAVEVLTGYRRVLHGEAVAMGMVHAARLSEQRALAPGGTASRLEALLRRLGLPTELPRFPRGAYLAALRVDKKRRDARIDYIVSQGIGRAASVALTPAEILPVQPRRRRGAAARARGRGAR